MSPNRRPSRSISDVTKFDCQCGHDDCEIILSRKVKALARRKESLLPSLQEDGLTRKSISKSPLPALFRKLSLVPDNEVNQAKQYGKVKKIFFSPHPDDVAYSCFGLASGKELKSTFSGSSRQSSNSSNTYSSAGSFATDSTLDSNDIEQSTLFSALDEKTAPIQASPPFNPDTWIVTIFSKSRCANGSIGQSLGHCVNATTIRRQREDEEFAQSIGAKLISLGLRDTSARDEGSRHPELLANTRNSLSSLTVNHPKFEMMRERVRPFVEWAIECKADIHIPVAVGCHIDHWMVRVAILSILYQIEQQKRWVEWSGTHFERTIDRNEADAEVQKQDLLRRFSISHRPQPAQLTRFGSQLIFYEDLPYAFLGTDDLVQRTVTQFLPSQVRTALIPMTEADWKRKKAAVEGYASQMKPTLLSMLHDHAMLLAKRASALDPSWENERSSEWTKAERCWILDDVCGLTGTLLTSVASKTVEEETHSKPIHNDYQSANKVVDQSPIAKIKFLSPFDTTAAAHSTKSRRNDLHILSPSSRTIGLDQISDDSGSFSLSPTQNIIRPIKALQRVATCPAPESFPISNYRR
ncbi:uncharacterized protein FA14DRAFT_160153 [Meira miltonrushii]|uniref:Uncharacterized protein n=1 Tax=Meira miltonrushii TaxID=1280837 RepID=A0A316VF42_9BASI|nr:uncharacterized protein FA14DRAFT_160153 [Meira miltonrushii]PWN34631.1 hypothetical protein FA14DRAFT_160153 [Meira miltonrushii]